MLIMNYGDELFERKLDEHEFTKENGSLHTVRRRLALWTSLKIDALRLKDAP